MRPRWIFSPRRACLRRSLVLLRSAAFLSMPLGLILGRPLSPRSPRAPGLLQITRYVGTARARTKIGLANLTYNMRRTVGFRGDVYPHGAKPPSAGVDQAKGNKTPGKSYLSMTPEPAPCRNWSQNSGSSVCPMANMAACVLIHSRPEFC